MLPDLDRVNNAPEKPSWTGPPVAVLWDQSLVWGLLLVEALEAMNVPYRLLTSSHIRSQALENYGVLVVPGGWASHKARVLGAEGLERIRAFLMKGGAYVGFCGGAGLALAGSSSLNLVPIQRKPLAQRLPNASGEVWIEGLLEHPFWKGLPQRIPVSIWWPSQFAWNEGPGVEAVARYRGYGEDFWVADLCVADVARCGGSWKDWEKSYGINLNPELLYGQAAILCCQVGKGIAVLSYPHLETPEGWGRRLLLNILHCLRDAKSSALMIPLKCSGACHHDSILEPPSVSAYRAVQEALEEARSLIAFGEKHLLWRWRRPWLLQWQRGVRGLEYGFLFVCLRFVVSQCARLTLKAEPSSPWDELAHSLLDGTRVFCQEARKLLLQEKAASQKGPVSKLQPVNASVDHLRETLFGRGMSHTGLSQDLFDTLDALVYWTLELRCRKRFASGDFWT